MCYTRDVGLSKKVNVEYVKRFTYILDKKSQVKMCPIYVFTNFGMRLQCYKMKRFSGSVRGDNCYDSSTSTTTCDIVRNNTGIIIHDERGYC